MNGNPIKNSTSEDFVLSILSSKVSMLFIALARSPLVNAPEDIPAISQDTAPMPPTISNATSQLINSPIIKVKQTLKDILIIKVLIFITPLER
ncbi:hypothetical protein RE628_19950 [Paenibacillus sp. D2_2]|nr:hypothetical protein [Paenibacillus sp. D2_2]WMT39658.1 hypothetical protein RE628_19950 [Paenibacillus sp. D2_2]